MKGHLLKRAAIDGAPQQIAVGEKLNLPNVDWAGNGRTVVLALNTGCHFCTDSAPFYRRLVERVSSSHRVHLVAVFPQPQAEASKYLNGLGVSIKDVRTTLFASAKVSGTPTLILVNEKGVVSDVWAGKLVPTRETEVLNKL